MYLLGQTCGIIGTIVTILQPQFRKKENILLCCIFVNLMSALNFALIGQTGSAVFLCLIAIVQGFVSLFHTRRNTPVTTWETILFFLLYMGAGFYGMIASEEFVWGINSHNLLELLPIVGALMLMFSVFAREEQQTRGFLFLNGAAWAVYSGVVGATAFFTAVAAMVSASVAMWKYRKKQ